MSAPYSKKTPGPGWEGVQGRGRWPYTPGTTPLKSLYPRLVVSYKENRGASRDEPRELTTDNNHIFLLPKACQTLQFREKIKPSASGGFSLGEGASRPPHQRGRSQPLDPLLRIICFFGLVMFLCHTFPGGSRSHRFLPSEIWARSATPPSSYKSILYSGQIFSTSLMSLMGIAYPSFTISS